MKPRKQEPKGVTANGLLTVRETARRLGVHENTVRNYIKDGRLKAAQELPSGYRRFDPKVVEARRKLNAKTKPRRAA